MTTDFDYVEQKLIRRVMYNLFVVRSKKINKLVVKKMVKEIYETKEII